MLAPEYDLHRHDMSTVVPLGQVLMIPQAFAFSWDSEHFHQQQIPSRDQQAPPHPDVWGRFLKAS
jgi:hypothetical protein